MRVRTALAGLTVAGSLAVVAMPGVASASGHTPTEFCHATGSTKNPYVDITTDRNGWVHGHDDHQGGRDINPVPMGGCEHETPAPPPPPTPKPECEKPKPPPPPPPPCNCEHKPPAPPPPPPVVVPPTAPPATIPPIVVERVPEVVPVPQIVSPPAPAPAPPKVNVAAFHGTPAPIEHGVKPLPNTGLSAFEVLLIRLGLGLVLGGILLAITARMYPGWWKQCRHS